MFASLFVMILQKELLKFSTQEKITCSLKCHFHAIM